MVHVGKGPRSAIGRQIKKTETILEPGKGTSSILLKWGGQGSGFGQHLSWKGCGMGVRGPVFQSIVDILAV